MKKKFTLFFLVVLIALGYYFLGFGLLDFDLDAITNSITDSITGNVIANPTTSYIQDEGEIQLYFCPQDDCETALVNFIDSAEESIHCALFDVGLKSVQNKLLEKERQAGIEVQVVTDNDYLKKFDHNFVKVDKWGLMHNKFCIIDNKKITTGSMNPTNNGAHKNNNNLLLIESEVLAANYQAEFQEMWEGTFKKGDLVLNPTLTVGDVMIKNYFCPDDHCANKVKEELKKAQTSIYFMTFSFTHDGIANIILLKNHDGLDIKGVMEARQVSKYSQYEVLKYQIDDKNAGEREGNIVKDGNKQNMHHKVFIIDEKTVVTGSMNPSKGGDTRNDENVLIIENEEIAGRFVEEFNRLHGEAKGNLLS